MPWAAAQQPQPAGHDGDPGGEARGASSPRARCDLPNLARGRAGWAWNWIEVLWHAVLHRALLRLVGGMAPSCTGPTMPGQRGRGRDRWTIGARRQRPAARPARADMSSETPHPDPASALAPEAPAPEPVPAEAATPQEAPAPLVAADAVEAAVDAEAEVEVEVESVAPMAAAAPATEQARMSLEACTVTPGALNVAPGGVHHAGRASPGSHAQAASGVMSLGLGSGSGLPPPRRPPLAAPAAAGHRDVRPSCP